MHKDQRINPSYRHPFSRLRPIHIDCRRPMLPIAALLAAGQWLGTRAWPAILLFLLVFLLAFLIRTCFCFRLRHFAWLLIACLVCGFFIQFGRHRPAQHESAVVAAKSASQTGLSGDPLQIELIGRVASLAGSQHHYATVIVKRHDGPFIALRGPASDLAYGSTVRVLADVSLPQGPRNPGGFDQAAWLRGKAVYLSAQAAEGEPIYKIQPAPAFSFTTWGETQRQQLKELTARYLSENQNALLAALLLGERQLLTRKDQALFRKAGLAHLMAVSGTHLSLLILPVDKGLKLSRIRRRRRILVLMLVLFLYGCLTGWPVSLSRAVIMNAAVLWGRFLLRPADSLNALALAAFVLLAARPDCVLSIGFWLSLLASGSLIAGVRPLAGKLRRFLPFLSQKAAFIVAAPLCVQLAVLPMALSLSGEMTWIGIIVNLPAAFLVQLILLSALAAIPAAALALRGLTFLGPLARTLFMPLAAFLNLLETLASIFGRLPLPRIQEGFFQPLVWLFLAWFILYSCGVMTSFLQFFNQSIARCRRFWLQGQLLLTAALLLFSLIHFWLQPPFTVWFLDVGQGDAILLRERGGQSVLVDGGPSGSGYRVLLPAMDALAINHIDLAIATHGHDDHLGGLVDLIEMRRVKKLAFPDGLIVKKDALKNASAAGAFNPYAQKVKRAFPADHWQVVPSRDEGSDRLVRKTLDAAQEADILVQTLRSHDTILFSQETVMTVLFPDDQTQTAFAARWLSRPVKDGNTLSLQILAQIFDYRLLLTGDCTGEVEQALVREGTWPDTDLLKVAHHGSARTTQMPFLEQTKPQAAVITVGAYNRYGHPARSVLENLKAVDCMIWRTDLHGAVRWQVWPSSWELSAMAGTPNENQR